MNIIITHLEPAAIVSNNKMRMTSLIEKQKPGAVIANDGMQTMAPKLSTTLRAMMSAN